MVQTEALMFGNLTELCVNVQQIHVLCFTLRLDSSCWKISILRTLMRSVPQERSSAVFRDKSGHRSSCDPRRWANTFVWKQRPNFYTQGSDCVAWRRLWWRSTDRMMDGNYMVRPPSLRFSHMTSRVGSAVSLTSGARPWSHVSYRHVFWLYMTLCCVCLLYCSMMTLCFYCEGTIGSTMSSAEISIEH